MVYRAACLLTAVLTFGACGAHAGSSAVGLVQFDGLVRVVVPDETYDQLQLKCSDDEGDLSVHGPFALLRENAQRPVRCVVMRSGIRVLEKTLIPEQMRGPSTRVHTSHLGGYVAGKTKIRLMTAHRSAHIVYTLDGKDPDRESKVYDNGIEVDDGSAPQGRVSIRARTVLPDQTLGPVRKLTYFVRQTPPTYELVAAFVRSKDEQPIVAEILRDGVNVNLALIGGQLVSGSDLSLAARGNVSATLERKSYTLSSSADFRAMEDIVGKRVFLISLIEDSGRINNFVAYQLLAQIGLFPAKFRFVELFINGFSRGIYLLVEPPARALRRTGEADAIVRRRFGRKYDVHHAKAPLAKSIIVATARDIYRILRNYRGEALLTELQARLNLDLYMRWLAFNSMIMNSDYTDELFLAGRLRTGAEPGHSIYFDRFSGWDFDDMFQPPHNNRSYVDRKGVPSLVYTVEDPLDRKIAADGVLYARYKEILSNLLRNEIPESRMKRVFDATMDAARPYLERDETAESFFSPSLPAEMARKRVMELSETNQKWLARRRAEILKQVGK